MEIRRKRFSSANHSAKTIHLHHHHRKEKDDIINCLEEKALRLAEQVDKLSSLVDRQEQYSRRNCILIHVVKENQSKGTDEVVVNKTKSEMDLEISAGDIDRTHSIDLPTKSKNRSMIVKFVRYMDGMGEFTSKKKLKGKNMSVTKSLTKIGMSALEKATNNFRCSSLWKADRMIMYGEEDDAKTKFILIDILTSKVALQKIRNCF